MTRRDFLDATLLGSGAMLLAQSSPAQLLGQAEWDGYGGVGDYRESNGNTYAVMAEGHRLRDGGFGPSAPVDTGEHFDCVIAGGGISGLSAALFFKRKAPPTSTCLVLDDHAIFGGLAKRNEFSVGGQHLIANQASAMFFPPLAGTFLEEFYRSIGIDDRQFQYQQWSGRQPEMPVGNTPYFDGGPNSAWYFGARFGKTPGVWVTDPWGSKLLNAPISADARRDLLRTRSETPYPEPKEHGDAVTRHLDTITLEQHLMNRYEISQNTVRTFLSPVAGGGSGIGADALSAYAEYAADVLLPWDRSKGVQMFPGGNAGVARHILKTLLPNSVSGPVTMAGVCRGVVDFTQLDRAQQQTRIRLRCTVMSVQQKGDHVEIVYSRGGTMYRVSARSVVIANGSWTAKYIVRDLPESHRLAYDQFYRSPALVANVAVRNWRFLYKLGISQAQWFEGIGNYFAIRKMATFGEVSTTISPDQPVVLTLKILFSYPGLTLAEQVKKGRAELLAASYAQYEQRICDHFTDLFGAWGFDAKRDIAGIILNRWGHAYLSAQPGFFFGTDGRPGPGEVLRNNPVGRIAFANSDLSGIMDHRASIGEARRAVDQCLRA